MFGITAKSGSGILPKKSETRPNLMTKPDAITNISSQIRLVEV